MLRTAKDFTGYLAVASDGEVGKIKDFLLNDRNWHLKYALVSTGRWLPGRKVLVPGRFLGQEQKNASSLSIELTKFQVEHGPTLEDEQPVSAQHVRQIEDYLGMPRAWSGAGTPIGEGPQVTQAASALDQLEEKERELGVEEPDSPGDEADPHLRSYEELRGYALEGRDESIGKVDEFILDDEGWVFRYAVVDTHPWWPGGRVLMPLPWIEDISYEGQRLHVELTRDTVQAGPTFDPTEPINRKKEEILYDYHGRPHYWA